MGIGILEPVINSDEVIEVNDEGELSDGGRWMKPDLMPSLSLGIGYKLPEEISSRYVLVWLRPKIFWQIPHKTSSTFNPVIQFGVSANLK